MASPQLKDGFIRIASEIVEALARIRISGEEMQVLLVILRKTYGWNKLEDMISLSQFALMTNLKKQTVVRAINKLLKKNLIIKKDNTPSNIFRFNKDFDTWKPLSKKITFIPESTLKKLCYNCGFNEIIEQHHIKHQSEGGSNRVENIIMLCPNCHSLYHRGKLTNEYLLSKKITLENINNIDNPIEKKPLSKMIHTKDTITKETTTKENTYSFNERFYPSYPKKVGRQQALKSWLNLSPSPELVETIITAVEKAKESKDWKKDKGQFIPYPSTYLNNKRWEDELVIEKDWQEEVVCENE